MRVQLESWLLESTWSQLPYVDMQLAAASLVDGVNSSRCGVDTHSGRAERGPTMMEPRKSDAKEKPDSDNVAGE